MHGRAARERDHASRMNGARTKGRVEEAMSIALKMLGMKMAVDGIAAATGLAREKVEGLMRGD